MRKIINLMFMFILIFFCSAYSGYKGTLAPLGSSNPNPVVEGKIIKEDKIDFEIDAPPEPTFNPKIFPEIYKTTVIQKNKYQDYFETIKLLEPSLEGLKDLMKDDFTNYQLFAAKANLIHIKTSSLKDKYKNKSEQNYNSYKKIVAFDSDLYDLVSYLNDVNKYKGTMKGNIKDEDLIRYVKQKNSKELLLQLDDILKTLKDEPLKKNSY